MNVRIAQLINFNAGYWYQDSLEMNEYTIKCWMITDTYSAEEQNIAIRRAKHFLYECMQNTIFVNATEDKKCKEFISVGLNVTTLPDEPADQLIGIMLFHKLNAIMEGRIKILEIEISSGTGVIYLHGENENSEGLIQPDWWATSDLTHCDFAVPDSEKVLSMSQTNVWRDLDLHWPEEPAEESNGNVVVFADFKQTDEAE